MSKKVTTNGFGILIKLFERVRLQTNTTNTTSTKVMTCVPGKIRTRLSAATYNNTWDGLLTHHKGQDSLVNCDLCGNSMIAYSLLVHRETQHNIYSSLVVDKDLLLERSHVTHRTGQSYRGELCCPVPGCNSDGGLTPTSANTSSLVTRSV